MAVNVKPETVVETLAAQGVATDATKNVKNPNHADRHRSIHADNTMIPTGITTKTITYINTVPYSDGILPNQSKSIRHAAKKIAVQTPTVANADLITDFAVFGGTNVFIPHGSHIAGQVGSNGTVNYLQGNSNAPTATGTVKADGTVTLDTGVTINGNILTNANVIFGGPGDTVTGLVRAGGTAPLNGATVVGGVTAGLGPVVVPIPLVGIPAPRQRVREFVFDHVRQAHLPTLMVTHEAEDAAAAGGPIIQLPDF